MRAVAKLTLAAVIAFAACGCGQQQQQRQLQQQGAETPAASDSLKKAGLEYYWQLPVKMDRGERLARPTLLDENLYFLTNYNRLVAIDAAKGEYKWSVNIAKAGEDVFRGPTHTNDVLLSERIPSAAEIAENKVPTGLKAFDAVVINTLSEALVINRANGLVVRRIALVSPANSAGCSDGISFFYASPRGWLYNIHLREVAKFWTIDAGGPVKAPVRTFGGLVYVGTQDGLLCAARAEMRSMVWQAKLAGPISTPFHVDKRGCFVACDDKRIYALNPVTKAQLWQPFNCRGEFGTPIQAGQNSIFQFAGGEGLYAIDIAKGTQRWLSKRGRMVMQIAGGMVYMLDDTRSLSVVDEMTGQEKFSSALSGLDLFAASTRPAAIYAADMDGRVVCIRQIGAERLTAEAMRKGD